MHPALGSKLQTGDALTVVIVVSDQRLCSGAVVERGPLADVPLLPETLLIVALRDQQTDRRTDGRRTQAASQTHDGWRKGVKGGR